MHRVAVESFKSVNWEIYSRVIYEYAAKFLLVNSLLKCSADSGISLSEIYINVCQFATTINLVNSLLKCNAVSGQSAKNLKFVSRIKLDYIGIPYNYYISEYTIEL